MHTLNGTLILSSLSMFVQAAFLSFLSITGHFLGKCFSFLVEGMALCFKFCVFVYLNMNFTTDQKCCEEGWRSGRSSRADGVHFYRSLYKHVFSEVFVLSSLASLVQEHWLPVCLITPLHTQPLLTIIYLNVVFFYLTYCGCFIHPFIQ